MSFHPAFWYWWVAGLLLMGVEAFFPGAFFLWMGLSSLVVGAVLWLLPGLDIAIQIGLWAVLAIGSVLTWRKLRGKPDLGPVPGGINERGRGYIGRTFTLDVPIVNNNGHVRVDDGQWRVSGPDLPATTRVKVVSVEGTVLKVEKAD